MNATGTFAVAGGVTIGSVDDAEAAIVTRSDGRMVRLGSDLARLLRELADHGPLDADDLLGRMDERWSTATVEATLNRLREADLVDVSPSAGGSAGTAAIGSPATGTAPRTSARVAWRPPMSLQVTLWYPGRGRGALLRSLAALTGKAGALTAGLLGVVGLIPAAGMTADPAGVLRHAIPVSQYVVALVAVLATVSVHELAHAATLVRHGGQPRRIGVMLFYLSPAMFCDVSDAWRLRPAARVQVALAGSFVHVAAGGLGALLAAAVPSAHAAPFLLFALLNYTYVLLNLVPFVKLDGYVALMGWVDVPFLRRRAMDEFHDVCTRVLFRAVPRPRLGPRWVPWFGAACSLMPFLLLASALRTVTQIFVALGRPGAVVALLVDLLLLGVAAMAVGRVLADGFRRRTGSPLRPALLLLAAVAVLGAVLSAVPIRSEPQIGFEQSAGGTELVLPPWQSGPDLPAGSTVALHRAGPLLGAQVGTGVVSGSPRPCTARVNALAPVVDFGAARTRARCLDVTTTSPTGAEYGLAVGPATRESVGNWLYRRLLAPSVDTLLGR